MGLAKNQPSVDSAQETPVLKVPSAVSIHECTYIINPKHPVRTKGSFRNRRLL